MTLHRLAPTELDAAAALLSGGSVVAVPTDTVYGLAACATSDAAVAALFAAKRRPTSVPVAVLVADTAAARSLALTWSQAAQRLAEAFWPGPLTLVVPAPRDLVERVHAPRGIGFRVPDDALCRRLLDRTGPLAVTSANLHGAAPSTSADEVVATFSDGTVDAVLDDGARAGEVSTVLDLCGATPAVVRAGALTTEVLEALRRG